MLTRPRYYQNGECVMDKTILLNKIITIDTKLRNARDELEMVVCCCRYNEEQQEELEPIIKDLRETEDLVNDLIFKGLGYKYLNLIEVQDLLKKEFPDLDKVIMKYEQGDK